MWYKRLAYKPVTHKLLKKQTAPFAEEIETDENADINSPDEQSPGDVETPTPNINEVLPPDLTTSIGVAPVDTPEPIPQSVNPDAPSPENPTAPHDGCNCDKRLREIPTNKPYKRIFWDADGACPICQANAKAFNQRQEDFFNRLNFTI